MIKANPPSLPVCVCVCVCAAIVGVPHHLLLVYGVPGGSTPLL